MEHDLYSNDFWHNRKIYNFEPYNVYYYKYSCAAYDCVCAAGTHTILPKVLAPFLMNGLTALVISMSTNLNV